MCKLRKTSQVWLAALAAFSLVSTTSAQTYIPGPVLPPGTWSPSSNPYDVIGNCTLATGGTLTIQPGVVVNIASGVSITNNGTIQAVGTASQRITFQSFTPSEFWTHIMVANGLATTNQFKYYDFQNATTETLGKISASEL